MFRKLFNNQISIVFTITLVLVVLLCQIGIWDSFFTYSGTHNHTQKVMAMCCNVDKSEAGDLIIQSHKDISNLPDNKLIYLIALLTTASPLFSYLLKFGSLNINNYFRFIRLKYGGFKLFSYFLYLFSSGIIQPKVY